MTFQEALSHFGNSRRKLAYALDISIQAVQTWAKREGKPIPKAREEQILKIVSERKQLENLAE